MIVKKVDTQRTCGVCDRTLLLGERATRDRWVAQLAAEQEVQSEAAREVSANLPARRRELRSGVGLVSDETAVGQGLEHRRDRTRGHRGDRGQAPGSHRNPRLALLLEQHGLQVVLDGGGRHIRTLAWNARAPSA